MSFQQVKNNAASILAADITDAATSLTVATGEGARFPASNFHITIEDEILLCSSRSGDVLTVTRAQEDTSAAAHAAGKAVRLNITAQHISELQDASKDIRCFCWSDVNIAIPTATFTPVPLDREDWDTDTMHDKTTNNERIYAKTAGVYLIVGLFRFASEGTGLRAGDLQHSVKGRLAWLSAAPLASGATAIVFSATCPMNVNEYVWMQAYQDSGAALSLEGGARDRTHLEMVRIGPYHA